MGIGAIHHPALHSLWLLNLAPKLFSWASFEATVPGDILPE
jgi:hypothetical protein